MGKPFDTRQCIPVSNAVRGKACIRATGINSGEMLTGYTMSEQSDTRQYNPASYVEEQSW